MSKLLQDVVGELSKLPGVGRRTALRLAIHILRMERDSVAEMTESIDRFRNEIRYCSQCTFIEFVVFVVLGRRCDSERRYRANFDCG